MWDCENAEEKIGLWWSMAFYSLSRSQFPVSEGD